MSLRVGFFLFKALTRAADHQRSGKPESSDARTSASNNDYVGSLGASRVCTFWQVEALLKPAYVKRELHKPTQYALVP
jgi:hypothetical protein